MRVYLAGAITADPATHRWREEADVMLAVRGIEAVSPLRKKDTTKFDPLGLTSDVSPLLFVERDERDVKRCDVGLVYTLGVERLARQSIGTWAELGLLRAHRKPIIVVADHRTVLEHPFVVKWAAAVVPTLERAVEVIAWME